MPTAQAVVFTSPGEAQILPCEVPSPKAGEILVQIHASAVSVGTEMRVFKGIQEPGQPFPQIPGYANAGVVIEAGEGAEGMVGQRVVAGGSQLFSLPSMWGGHASHVVVPASEVVPLPDGLSFTEGAVVRLGAIAFRGFDLAAPQKGDKVLALGMGVIGQMAARIYAAEGYDVRAVDLSPIRVEAAKADGISAQLIGSLAEAQEIFPEGADIIVDATGSERVLRESIPLAKMEPWGVEKARSTKYVIQGSYPGDFAVPYQEAFLRQLIYLLPRDNTRHDRAAFLKLLASGRAKVGGIIKEFPLEEAPQVYKGCLAGEPTLIAPVLLWPQG